MPVWDVEIPGGLSVILLVVGIGLFWRRWVRSNVRADDIPGVVAWFSIDAWIALVRVGGGWLLRLHNHSTGRRRTMTLTTLVVLILVVPWLIIASYFSLGWLSRRY